MPFRSDDTDGLDHHEWPEPDPDDDAEAALDTDTVPCPFCHHQVYDNAEWCPHCRNYLFYDGPPLSQKPWWLIGGVVVCLAIVFYWIFR